MPSCLETLKLRNKDDFIERMGIEETLFILIHLVKVVWWLLLYNAFELAAMLYKW